MEREFFIFRILYGQLFRRSLGADNKSNLASRRAVILRFLAGCADEEFKVFTNLLLEPFEGILISVIHVCIG